MSLLPLALAVIGILFDLLSLAALLCTRLRRRWCSGFPGVALLFYLPAAILTLLGWHPPPWSPTAMLLLLGGLAALHIPLHWLNGPPRPP